jgi:hypothetical protein
MWTKTTYYVKVILKGGYNMKVNYVGIAPYPQSYAKAHIHDEWEIILNLEGYGIARIGNKQYEFARAL